MARPARVVVDEETIARIAREFRTTEKRVEGLLLSLPDYTAKNRQRALAEIRRMLSQALSRADAAMESELRRQFTVGSRDASQQLNESGIAVKAAVGVAAAATLAIIIDEARESLRRSATNVSINAKRVLTQAATKAIQQQQLAGVLSRREAARRSAPLVRQAIRDARIFGIIDRRGASWTLDRYMETSLRSLAVQARNTAVASKNLEAGIDLVKVPDNGSKHDVCKRWQGKILSLTGDTPGYPTVDEARADGLWHPNCSHPYESLSKAQLVRELGADFLKAAAA